jgi:hypothetical protein
MACFAAAARAKVRHNSLATYILLRGITLLIRVGNKQRNRQHHPWLWHLLAPTRLQHGDTLMMCLSCSQIIYAFIFAPQTLPTSYVRFIQKQGAKELYIWQGIRVRRLMKTPKPSGLSRQLWLGWCAVSWCDATNMQQSNQDSGQCCRHQHMLMPITFCATRQIAAGCAAVLLRSQVVLSQGQVVLCFFCC